MMFPWTPEFISVSVNAQGVFIRHYTGTLVFEYLLKVMFVKINLSLSQLIFGTFFPILEVIFHQKELGCVYLSRSVYSALWC